MNAEAFIVQDFAAPSSPSPSPPPESSTPAAEDPEEGTVDPDDDIVPCESMLQPTHNLCHCAPATLLVMRIGYVEWREVFEG